MALDNGGDVESRPDDPPLPDALGARLVPAGLVVHLRLVTGAIRDYEALVRRAIAPA